MRDVTPAARNVPLILVERRATRALKDPAPGAQVGGFPERMTAFRELT